jgi:heme/copper-type cytochrome/quinol oxidase subunit 2
MKAPHFMPGLAILLTFQSIFYVPVFAETSVRVTLTDTRISPGEIEAVKGQDLHIEVTNAGQKTHNFVIPDMYIFSQNLTPGESTSISFTPDKTGSFRYYSDTGGKPEPGLSGTLRVS